MNTHADGVLERIGLVVHGGRRRAVDAAEVVRGWCTEHDVAWVDIDVWDDDAPRRSAHEEAARAGRLDLLVTLGGDGTFLRGVRVASAAGDVAVLGVDVGRVGFLTEVGVDEVAEALEAVHHGRARYEERLTLTMRASRPLEVPPGMEALLRYGRGPALPPPRPRPGMPETGWGVPLEITAVNDVVFEKLARDRQASLGVYLGDRLFAAYSADALVVASPTGSTAYSFSAGGPVLSPRLAGLVLTPVAPHMVFDRSLVLAADEAVSVRVLERSGQVAVSVDGQLRGVLDPGDWVAVYAAPWRARLVRLHPSDFYGRLRARFGLADAPAAAADSDGGAGGAPLVNHPDEPAPPDLQHLFFPRDPPGASPPPPTRR